MIIRGICVHDEHRKILTKEGEEKKWHVVYIYVVLKFSLRKKEENFIH